MALTGLFLLLLTDQALRTGWNSGKYAADLFFGQLFADFRARTQSFPIPTPAGQGFCRPANGIFTLLVFSSASHSSFEFLGGGNYVVAIAGKPDTAGLAGILLLGNLSASVFRLSFA